MPKPSENRKSRPLTKPETKRLHALMEGLLQQVAKEGEILALCRKQMETEFGIILSNQRLLRHLKHVRGLFEQSSGFSRVSLESIVQTRIRDVLIDKKAGADSHLKAIAMADRIFGLRRKPDEDRDIVEQVVRSEQERLHSLSDDQLAQYAELLQSPDMDREFATMVDYRRRGVAYLPELRQVQKAGSVRQNVLAKRKDAVRRKRGRPRRVKPIESTDAE